MDYDWGLMKIPLTKFGMPEVAVYPASLLVAMAGAYLLRSFVSPDWAYLIVEAILAIVLIWVLSFFRDPDRAVPQDKSLIISPADGTISDIEELKKADGFDGPVLRIGIFLSVFNVHINRTPCDVKIDKIQYKLGLFKNALSPDSAKVNESNDIYMTQLNQPKDKMLVRQISGAIARRIVCKAAVGDKFLAGDKFGMIKFGSRTEIYIPIRANLKNLVKIGDKTKAGLTILARYENA